MTIQEPNDENVSIGDLVAASMPGLGIRLMPVKSLGDTVIICANEVGTVAAVQYSRALVLKKDGTYLVGRDLQERIEEIKNYGNPK